MNTIHQILIAVMIASFLTFVALNTILGCASWEDESCITPQEFLEIFFKWS